MRNDHFLRRTGDDRSFIEQRVKQAEQRRRTDSLGWLLLIACGLVLGSGIAALLSLILPGFIP